MYSGENPHWGKPEHSTDWRRFDVLGCARLCTVATPTSRECVCAGGCPLGHCYLLEQHAHAVFVCDHAFCVVGQAAWTCPDVSARRLDGEPRGMHPAPILDADCGRLSTLRNRTDSSCAESRWIQESVMRCLHLVESNHRPCSNLSILLPTAPHRTDCACRHSSDWTHFIQWIELHPRVPRGPAPPEFESQPFQPKSVTSFWDEGAGQPMRLGANECHCSR